MTTWQKFIFRIVALLMSVRFSHLLHPDSVFAPSAMEKVLAGTADFPFSQRILSPYLCLGLTRLASMAHLHLSLSLAAFALECLSFFLIIEVFTRTLALFIRDERVYRTLGLTVAFPLAADFIQSRFQYNWYSYDFPSVFFWEVFVYVCLTSRNLYYILPITALATLNRESSLLFTAVYFLTTPKVGRLRTLANTALIAATVFAVKAVVLVWFTHSSEQQGALHQNPFMLINNLGDLRLGINYLQVLGVQAYGWLFLLMFHRNVRHRAVAGLLWVVPIHFVVCLLTGVLMEVRIFGDVAPIVWLGCCLILCDWMDKPAPLVVKV